jgi:hypothetical protein
MDSLRHRHIAATDRIPCVVREAPLKLAGAAIAFLVVAQAARLGADASPYAAFQKTLTAPAEAPFPTIAPFRATYRFGWEGVGAGGAPVEVARGLAHDQLMVVAKGGPNSLIRKLWNYQALYVGEAGDDGGVPSWFRIDEEVSKGDLLSEAVFGDDSVLVEIVERLSYANLREFAGDVSVRGARSYIRYLAALWPDASAFDASALFRSCHRWQPADLWRGDPDNRRPDTGG